MFFYWLLPTVYLFSVLAREDGLGGTRVRGDRPGRGRVVARLHLAGVVLDEGLEVAVPPGGVEVVLLHFGVDLIVAPAVLLEAVDRAHRARAVAPARAVDEELAGRGVVNRLHEGRDPLGAGVRLIDHRDVDVAHPRRLDHAALVTVGLLLKVDDRADAELLEGLDILHPLRLGAAVEALVHLAEVLDADA